MLSRGVRLEGERLTIVTNGGGAACSPPTASAISTAALPPRPRDDRRSRRRPARHLVEGQSRRHHRRRRRGALRQGAGDRARRPTDRCRARHQLSDGGRLEPGRGQAAIAVGEAAGRRGGRPRPLLANWLGDATAEEPRRLFAAHGVPSFETPSEAIEGFMQLVNHRRAQDELMQTPPSLGSGEHRSRQGAHDRRRRARPRPHAAVGGRGEGADRRLRHPHGRDRRRRLAGRGQGAAGRIVARHGAVVVKILSDDLSHKSDVGGVRLGIAARARRSMRPPRCWRASAA